MIAKIESSIITHARYIVQIKVNRRVIQSYNPMKKNLSVGMTDKKRLTTI